MILKRHKDFSRKGILNFTDRFKEKALSKGELASVRAACGLDSLIDESRKEYKLLNLDKIRSASMREEMLLNNPVLYKTPIVRNGRLATVGYQPDVWKGWE